MCTNILYSVKVFMLKATMQGCYSQFKVHRLLCYMHCHCDCDIIMSFVMPRQCNKMFTGEWTCLQGILLKNFICIFQNNRLHATYNYADDENS